MLLLLLLLLYLIFGSVGLSGGCRASTVLYSERPSGSSADRRVFKHQPLQDTEGLLLLVRVRDGRLPLPFSLFLWHFCWGKEKKTTAMMCNWKSSSTKLSSCQLIPHAINTKTRTERICRSDCFMSVMVHFHFRRKIYFRVSAWLSFSQPSDFSLKTSKLKCLP